MSMRELLNKHLPAIKPLAGVPHFGVAPEQVREVFQRHGWKYPENTSSDTAYANKRKAQIRDSMRAKRKAVASRASKK